MIVKDCSKYEELEYKKNELKLDIKFLNSWEQVGVYLKFLTFKLSNVSNKDVSSIRKRLQKLLQQKKLLNRKNYHHWRGVVAYLYSQLSKLLLTSHNLNYPRKNPIYLKQVYTFQSNQIKIRKSEIFTTFGKVHPSFINNLKSKETKSEIKVHLSYLANSYFYNYKPSPRILHQHRFLQNLRKNKDIIITFKPNL